MNEDKIRIKIYKMCFVESFDGDGYGSTIIPTLANQSEWMEVTKKELEIIQLFIKSNKHVPYKYNEQYILIVEPEHWEYEQLMMDASKFAQEWEIKEQKRLDKEKKLMEEEKKKQKLAEEKRRKKKEDKEKKLLADLTQKYNTK